ncbi:class I SAM-dependent methyltransferase [Paenibacillus terrigena]|uniref:class I SAM-dependent methyltransferase n=1 Tax=Paenibacillus terrigena TaxID=369333 RepID=UPI0028D27258|nr:class I SAM-dependent methyltransferase [Paenibacillus terrigena]
MIYFWNEIICPILRITRPNTIVEIGSAQGFNTTNLLLYGQSAGSKLIVIDPHPLFDVEQMKQVWGSQFEMIQDYSLQALPKLGAYDAILIDGDHNWYTVYHELKEIEKTENFPIIFLHDTEWPYGRRDMYYFPESIPESYRKPNAAKGIMPGISELVDGGHNATVNNALYEYGDKNGVLTAIEDFLSETSLNLRFHRVHSQHGLGIIVPSGSSIHTYYNQMIEEIIRQSNL